MVYVTRDLASVLLEVASEWDPNRITAGLDVTPARDLDWSDPGPPAGDDLVGDTSVFTHVYLPEAGRSVTAVFGMDLNTPAGRTPGLFVSHPDGRLGIDRRDDLREVVIVAVPPWNHDSLAAYDRGGRRLDLDLIGATPPDESLP